jgi:hypothetical protein
MDPADLIAGATALALLIELAALVPVALWVIR